MNPALELVVGLEVHVQLATETKLFCGCRTSFGAAPNTHVCPVCLGLPGALPVLNRRAVELAVRAGLGFGSEIQTQSVFARKNYFYPDLPKGYQISQYDRPFAVGGGIFVPSTQRFVRLTRIHMEEDAGKSIHDRFPSLSAIDLNRAGSPLIEIVTEPMFQSGAEAREFLQLLREVLLFLMVSDANMEEGSLRVDANVSVRPVGTEALGIKTEIKNMNSFSGVERAIALEFARQISLVSAGERVRSETLLFDADADLVRPARSKEESHDYRYFPDPDILPLRLDVAWIDQQRRELPALPAARRESYIALGVPAQDTRVLTAEPALADYFDRVLAAGADARSATAWIVGDMRAWLNDNNQTAAAIPLFPRRLASLLQLVQDGVLSRTAAKRVFSLLMLEDAEPRSLAERENLIQIGDSASLVEWVEAVWGENPDEVARLRAGEQKLLGVLVGLVMKRSAGRADPKRVNQLLRDRLAQRD